MHKIKYINDSGAVLDIGGDDRLTLMSITGLESTSVEDETSKSPRQDGMTYNNQSAYKERPVILKFHLRCHTYEDYLTYRDSIIRAFNPKVTGVLDYKDGEVRRQLYCKPETGIDMPKNSISLYCDVTVDLIAYDPYLYDPAVNTLELTFWTGGLVFPLVFPISFRKKGETKLNIVVDGQEPAPLSIAFKGPAVNPKVINHTTGEFIEVLKDLNSDQVLHITTGFKKQSVKIEENGILTDAYDKINIESTFFELMPGANLLEYTSGETSPNDVAISFRNRYSGI